LTQAIVLARLATELWFGNRPALLFILIPILLSAYLGGLMAGLASTGVGAVATSYFVMPPVNQFGFENSVDAVEWLFLIVVGGSR
jgi:K+-sensing histidine kinase KdpD